MEKPSVCKKVTDLVDDCISCTYLRPPGVDCTCDGGGLPQAELRYRMGAIHAMREPVASCWSVLGRGRGQQRKSRCAAP